MRHAPLIRRSRNAEARMEIVPLIDIIFLLLTFFIYSLVVMVQARVLPVELVRVTGGQAPAEVAEIAAVTIDAAGRLYLNREPIEAAALDAELARIAAAPEKPTLFLAMEEAVTGDGPGAAAGTPGVDRGPLLVNLIERVRRAGVTNFSIVGQP